MARFISYGDFINSMHNEGVSAKQVAKYMHISFSTLKHKFDREVDNDVLYTINDAVKEACEENAYRRKLGMYVRRYY